MTYVVTFTASAAREVRKLDRPVRSRLLEAIESLGSQPRPHGCIKLAEEERAWRIRVGDHRVIYEIDDGVLVVTAIRAAHRREAYRP